MRPLNLGGTTEVSPLGGEGNKPLFPFKGSLKLLKFEVLPSSAGTDRTALSYITLVSSVAACPSTGLPLLPSDIAPAGFVRNIFFLNGRDELMEHPPALEDGEGGPCWKHGAAANKGNVIASLFSCRWISNL